jgi:hypothetical protein
MRYHAIWEACAEGWHLEGQNDKKAQRPHAIQQARAKPKQKHDASRRANVRMAILRVRDGNGNRVPVKVGQPLDEALAHPIRGSAISRR